MCRSLFCQAHVSVQAVGGGACIGGGCGKNNPRNAKVNEFMRRMRDIARPIDLDHPQDEGRANNGMRKQNIAKASRACTSLISMSC